MKAAQKFLFVFSLIFFTACAAKNDQPQVRIVDLQGRAKSVKTRYPELNAQALASQGFSTEPRDINQPAAEVGYRSPAANAPTKTPAPKNDFGSVSAQNIQQTLQPSMPMDAARQEAAATAASPIATQAGSPKDEAIEYDLAEAKGDAAPQNSEPAVAPQKSEKKYVVKKPAKKAVKEVASKPEAKGGKKFYAQVGSFSNQASADSVLANMKKFHAGKIEVAEGEKTMYRVWLGPFSNRVQANNLIQKIKDSGGEAVLVRGK